MEITRNQLLEAYAKMYTMAPWCYQELDTNFILVFAGLLGLGRDDVNSAMILEY